MTVPHPLGLLRCPYVIGGIGLLGLSFGVWCGYLWGHAEPPAPSTAAQVVHQQTVQAESIAAKVDTLYRIKEKVVGVSIGNYRTVRTQLDSALARLAQPPVVMHDTVWDSVRVHDVGTVQQVVAKCDSLASDCEAFKQVASTKRAADSVVVAATSTELQVCRADAKAERSASRSRIVKTALVTGVLGATAALLLHR